MAIILSAQNVTKRFGGLVAVNNVSVDIEEKTIYAVIGPNGAGKTTFFNCITGFYTPEEGEINFNGNDIKGISTDQITRFGISRTYQNIRLFSNMTALENIMVGQEPNLHSTWIGAVFNTPGMRKEEQVAHKRAMELLNFVKLTGMGDHLAKNLPYGAQRRLEIARALASSPKLLLLDEPTAGMNPNETTEMTSFITHVRDELGVTILLIEHDMRVVMGISDWITVLDYGANIAEGTPRQIRNNPKVIEAYLGTGAAGAAGDKLVEQDTPQTAGA